MKINVNVEDEGAIIKILKYDLQPTDTVETVAHRVAVDLESEVDDVLPYLGFNGSQLDKHTPVTELLKVGKPIRIRRVCIDLHFETESVTHRFSPHAKWRRVHRFGCKKFDVASDACANLELHEDVPEGPPLNENAEIGSFAKCKTVWLVKPGPEPNGKF